MIVIECKRVIVSKLQKSKVPLCEIKVHRCPNLVTRIALPQYSGRAKYRANLDAFSFGIFFCSRSHTCGTCIYTVFTLVATLYLHWYCHLVSLLLRLGRTA